MTFDLLAVVVANVDVDTNHSAFAADQFENRRMKDQRPAVGDARLDDQIGLHAPKNLLHGDDILRILNDRPAEPGEVVRVVVLTTLHQQLVGRRS